MGNTGGRHGGGRQDEPQRPRGEPQGSREERLAAALRENLRRRKAQARARKGSGEPGKEAPVRSNPGRA